MASLNHVGMPWVWETKGLRVRRRSQCSPGGAGASLDELRARGASKNDADRCEPSVPLDGKERSEGTASVLGDEHVCCAWLLTEWVGMPTPFSTTWMVDGLEL